MNEELDSIVIFPWSENLETGITIIDEQHKKIICILNKLVNTLVNDDATEVSRVFDELAAYAKYHFETEEAIWKQHFSDDKWMLSRQKTHASFLPDIISLKDELGDKPLREVVEHLIKFLIHWLASHIIDGDKRMAIVLQNVNAGTSLKDAKKISDEEMGDSSQILIDTVLTMYDEISSRTIELMREILERKKAEKELRQANKKLEKLAITDQLTGLHNRRHFDEVFELELRRSKRDKNYLSFIIFDLDYFKKLNDRYGHVQGDLALKQVGHKLKELCRRPSDFAFRLGGEEFGVLIADQTSLCGETFAEMIRAEIKSLGIPNVDSNASNYLTASVGVITKIPSANDSAELYMHAADDRLYQAKAQGRNQIVNFEYFPTAASS